MVANFKTFLQDAREAVDIGGKAPGKPALKSAFKKQSTAAVANGVTKTSATANIVASTSAASAPAAASPVLPAETPVTPLQPSPPKLTPEQEAEKERKRIARKKERRATLILGLIMGSFIACWLTN